eukprot:1294521-Amphidinium_carterae.1
MGIRHFDLVVLMTSTRFTEPEALLLDELLLWGVPYFIVRTGGMNPNKAIPSFKSRRNRFITSLH